MKELITIVIPCFNEKESLPELIKKIQDLTIDINFIIVDNGSTDGSTEYLQRIETKLNTNVSLYFIDQNKGYGHGVYTGLKLAKTKFVGWIHGDFQFNFESLEKSVSFFSNNIVGNRFYFYKGIRTGRSLLDRFFSYFMGVLATMILKNKYYEINAQPTIFSRELLNYITSPPNNFSFDTYVFWLAVEKGFVVKRELYSFPPRKYGLSKWDFGLISKIKFSISLIKYFWSLRKNND